MKIEMSAADLFVIPLCIAAGVYDSPWWYVGALLVFVSWFWRPRWSRMHGWRLWR